MIAANLENLLFLLLVALAALFQLLAKTAGKTSRGQRKRTSTPIPGTPPPIAPTPRESGEEQIRKFLEALGQPSTSKPPPPVVSRTDIPPRPLAPVPPPLSPLSQLRREKARKRDVISKEIRPPRPISGAEIAPPPITVTAGFEVHEGPLPIESPPGIKAPAEAYAAATRRVAKTEDSRTDIATLLASKSSLRAAIILREILGPPRGLRA
jgi:hypothetical protein